MQTKPPPSLASMRSGTANPLTLLSKSRPILLEYLVKISIHDAGPVDPTTAKHDLFSAPRYITLFPQLFQGLTCNRSNPIGSFRAVWDNLEENSAQNSFHLGSHSNTSDSIVFRNPGDSEDVSGSQQARDKRHPPARQEEPERSQCHLQCMSHYDASILMLKNALAVASPYHS